MLPLLNGYQIAKKNQIRINYLERNMCFDGYLIHSFALRGWIVPITTKMENV